MRQFSAGTIEALIKESERPSVSLGDLARLLCRLDDWHDSQNRPMISSARKTVVKLADKVGFALPEKRAGVPETRVSASAPEGLDSLQRSRLQFKDLGDIRVAVIDGCEQRRSWDAMMEKHHPNGFGRAPGAQLRYWIVSSEYGIVGGIGFAAASWHQKARDEWIGWSQDARVSNLQKVICNQRFLLIPRVYGLASVALERVSKCVASDWERCHKVRPLLMYTYVDGCYRGSCYGAAGWHKCDRFTSGHAQRRAQPGTPKAIWFKPLSDDWKDQLCREQYRAITKPKAVYLDDKAHWAEREYARTSHSDGRVRGRIIAMGRAWVDHQGKSIASMFPNRADRKGAYRLLSNEQVRMEHILEPHQASLAERCEAESVVLAVQDTTTLNYHGLSETEGLVGIGGRGKGASGILAHFGIAVTETGRTLGVYALNAGFRRTDKKVLESEKADTDEKESRRWMDGLLRARELSDACSSTRVVTVCDREADLWPLLRDAQDHGDGLLVRSNAARKRKVILEDGSAEKLDAHMKGQPVTAHKTIRIAACGGRRARKGRKARLEIRACEVTLRAPAAVKDKTPVKMLALSVDEMGVSPDQKPLHWLLLTTEGQASVDNVHKIVRWYEKRWHIETWFSVLKNGSKIATRQFDHADDLRKCLVFDAVTACYIHDLNYMARNNPDVKARNAVGNDQVACLYEYRYYRGITRVRSPPGHDPTIRQFVIDLAGVAGFDSRKSQPLPGTRKLWEAYEIFTPALVYHRGVNAENNSK